LHEARGAPAAVSGTGLEGSTRLKKRLTAAFIALIPHRDSELGAMLVYRAP